jgi:hypothetical protein
MDVAPKQVFAEAQAFNSAFSRLLNKSCHPERRRSFARSPQSRDLLLVCGSVFAECFVALTALAMVLTRMTRTEEGISYFQKIVELEPKSSGTHLNLGIAYADEFDLEGALAEFF